MQVTKFAFIFLGVFLLLGVVFASGEDQGFGEQFKEKQKQFSENLKEKMEKLKEDYKERLEKYNDKKQEWQEHKQRFDNNFLDSNKGRQLTANYLDVLGAKVQDHMEKIKDKNGFFASLLDSKVEEINSVIANLDENTTKEELQNAIKEIKTIWANSEHTRKLATAQKYLEGIDKVIPKMENALNNLDSKLDTLENATLDTNTARTAFYKAQESVANLKLQFTVTEEKLNQLKDSNNLDVNSINALVKELNSSIQETRKEIVNALVEYNKLKRNYAQIGKKDKDDDDLNDNSNDDSETEIEDENELETEDDNSSDSNTLSDDVNDDSNSESENEDETEDSNDDNS